MRLPGTGTEIPTWVPVVVLVLFFASLVYGIVVMQSLTAPILAWLWIFGIGVSLFVVYLLYRFVVAVETIARKL